MMSPEEKEHLEEREVAADTVAVDISEGGSAGNIQEGGTEANPFHPEASLEFVNISSTGAEDEQTVEGEKVGLWGRVTTGYNNAKAFKDSMTRDLAPWTQFSDRRKFSVPSKTQIFGRIKNNLKLYHANYLVLLGALAVWTAISNLTFVLAMFSSVGLYYYYRMQTHDNSTFRFMDREIHPVQFYIFLTSLTLFLFWLTGGGSTMFWMVASAAFVVFGHASFRETDENEESISPEQALQALNALRS